jgi:putative ABC transport system permease protein
MLPRTPPLAWRNVTQARARSLAAIAGIALALVMVLLQLGFLHAVKATASVNYDALDFDLMIVSHDFQQFYDPGSFPRERLNLARSVPGVVSVRPLWASMNVWHCPPYPLEHPPDIREAARVGPLERWWLGTRYPRTDQRRELLSLGVDLDQNPFRDPIRSQVQAHREELRLPGRVLFNAWSNPDFGWSLRDEFRAWELGAMAVTIAGPFTLDRSFGADATVLSDEATFARSLGQTRLATVPFGLVRVADRRQLERTTAAIREALPRDVEVLDRRSLTNLEQEFWVSQTATGQIFEFGVIVAMIVAGIVIYQVLSNDVRKRLPEYATLKAMGHSDPYLARVVLVQALIYGLAAYLPAVLVSAGIYQVTRTLAHIPMVLVPENLGLVLALDLFFAAASGLLAVRRLRDADPAELF